MNTTPSALPKVALFKGHGVVSSLIQWQTRSIYSHAAIWLPGTERTVIESREFAGVREHEYTPEEWAAVDLFDVAGSDHLTWQIALSFARAQIGMPYDYWSVARFLTKRPARENGTWFCSELVHKALSAAGIRLLARIPSAEVSPGELAVSPLLLGASDDIPSFMLLNRN